MQTLSPLARSACALAALLVLSLARAAGAREGTHPVVLATWDARASFMSLAFRHGVMSGGGFDTFGYQAAFSSTTGKLSSQFGLHYVTFADDSDDPRLHGLAASAVALFIFPLARRYDDGLPRSAIGAYVGSAPTGLVSGRRNDFSLPLLLGVGVPFSPEPVLSVTPWAELSPGVSLDTRIQGIELSAEDPTEYIDPVTGEVRLTEADVERVLSDAVDFETSFAVGLRAGVDLALHATEVTDVNAHAALSTVGSAFRGSAVLYVGGGLTFRWDAIVPAVLPPERRLQRERCENIEERFRSCPNAEFWLDPEATEVE